MDEEAARIAAELELARVDSPWYQSNIFKVIIGLCCFILSLTMLTFVLVSSGVVKALSEAVASHKAELVVVEDKIYDLRSQAERNDDDYYLGLAATTTVSGAVAAYNLIETESERIDGELSVQ